MPFNISWPIGSGFALDNLSASPKKVIIDDEAGALYVEVAALDKAGAPINGQRLTVPLPPQLYEEFVKANRDALMVAMTKLPSEYYTGLNLPDFSKSTWTPDA